MANTVFGRCFVGFVNIGVLFVLNKIRLILKNKENYPVMAAAFIMLSIFWTIRYAHVGGRDIPPEQELHYISGVLKTVTVAKDKRSPIKHISIYDKTNNKQLTIACGDHVFPRYLFTDCTHFEQYQGKQAKIGWYQQKDVLWFSNDIPQMATVEVEGNVIRSYYVTVDMAKSNNLQDLIFMLGLTIGLLILFYKGGLEPYQGDD